MKTAMKNVIGRMYLLVAFSLAGTSVVTGRILRDKLSSFTITAVSLGILLICLLPFYWKRIKKTVDLLTCADWKMLVLQAVFGIFLFRVFLLFGVQLTSTVEAGFLTGVTPAVTSLLAFIFLKEQCSKRTVLGIVCTVTGIVLLQGAHMDKFQASAQYLGGNLLILCAALSESAFNVLSRKHRAHMKDTSTQIHPVVQMLLVSAIAFVLSLIPLIWEDPFVEMQTIGLAEWLALIWYGLIVTAVAFAFFYAGVKRCDAYTTAAFSGIIPLTSLILSVFLLKEALGCYQLAGGALIVFSIFLIGSKQKSRQIMKRPIA